MTNRIYLYLTLFYCFLLNFGLANTTTLYKAESNSSPPKITGEAYPNHKEVPYALKAENSEKFDKNYTASFLSNIDNSIVPNFDNYGIPAADICANRQVNNITNCTNGGALAFSIRFENLGNRYSFDSGSFVEYTDGTAQLSGRVRNNDRNAIGFDVVVNFSGRTNQAGADGPILPRCLDLANPNFYYYAQMDGVLTGIDEARGARVTINEIATPTQLGIGAQRFRDQLTFGLSSWFVLNITNQPSTSLVLEKRRLGNNGQDGDFHFVVSMVVILPQEMIFQISV